MDRPLSDSQAEPSEQARTQARWNVRGEEFCKLVAANPEAFQIKAAPYAQATDVAGAHGDARRLPRQTDLGARRGTVS